MSPQQQDAENYKSRPRANTNSFAPFSWRRGRPEPSPVPPVPVPITHPLTLDALIDALTPPAVPSLGYARSLASALSSHSPIPHPASLNPVLASLCAVDSPVSLQSAGYDILSAYWENNEVTVLSTADRLAYFSFFLGPSIPWGLDLWEPRFKALRALSKWGAEIVGIETPFLNVLKSWIQGGFEGLLVGGELLERAERAERERSIDVLAAFLTSVVENPEIVARIPEEELAGVLQFYAGLVDRSIEVRPESTIQDPSVLSTSVQESNASTPSRSHRRHHSSVSLASLPSPTVPPVVFYSKHPADVAINHYLNHLFSQLKTLSPTYLCTILPLLFRALAFYATPLPRLTVMAHSPRKSSPEDRIVETLNILFAGPYSTTCMMNLKRHLYPPTDPDRNMHTAIQESIGAQRTLRNYIRRGLCTRLARAYISRETSVGYAPSGAPGHMDVERDLMERAWPKDDVSGWDAGKLGRVLCKSVQGWVGFDLEAGVGERRAERERILEEAAGTLKDVLQELDSREDDNVALDDEEAAAVGETLYELSRYVLLLKNRDGTSFVVPISQPSDAPTPFLRALSALLARDHATNLTPLLSTTLLMIAENLTDADTAKLPIVMAEQHDLSPTSPEWLRNWENLLGNPTLVNMRPLTRQTVMHSLQSVYDSVKDMPAYRMPLADLVYEFCQRQAEDVYDEDSDAIWRILGDEVILRTVASSESGSDGFTAEGYIDLLVATASENGGDDDDDDAASTTTADTHSPSPHAAAPTAVVSPILSRMQTEFQPPGKEKESSLPSVISLLTSLTTGNSSRSQSMHPQARDDQVNTSLTPPLSENISLSRVVGAVSALVSIFGQLAFTPFALSETNLSLAVRIYNILIKLLVEGKSPKARLTVLQFLMRVRADRDHRLYYADSSRDPEGVIPKLASLINRVWGDSAIQLARSERNVEESSEGFEYRTARARIPQERDGRRKSRGRGGAPSNSTSSRSRSRVAARVVPPTAALKPRNPIWQIPETVPFVIAGADTPSEALISYDPIGPDHKLVLPISAYLSAVLGILEKERDWEILSYVLCHLPVQLANKHLFCGPRSRDIIAKLLTTLCTGILNGELGSYVDRWPHGLKVRDAYGLAYHTLSVLVSYRRCFDMQLRHLLVEVFQAGLNGQPSTIKCCLHALSLSAFELQPSMTKCLPRILEKLSQIMSNPDMAVHILGFLSIIGSLRPLHANFTESDFKMVFGVALQYLQHHNRIGVSPTISWALSQHVRILSYYVVYVWFLAVKLPDRPRHVRYITRQLLLANEGNTEVDDPTEVCFDWLARYTYASADPRPANSLLNDVVMNSTMDTPSPELSLSEKTWIYGNSVVTIRTLARLGWLEVLSRRPSGFTKFLCRVENAPMVAAGDVDPDMLSGPAVLMMERDPPIVQTVSPDLSPDSAISQQGIVRDVFATNDDGDFKPTRPDPITGYVWSGSAPSQRRKGVAIDPAFLALQLSSYPNHLSSPHIRMIVQPAFLPKFFASLDRIPVIDTHKVGIIYVAPGQNHEFDILRNTHGSPAYTRFLEGIGRLINLRGQVDVYAGGLDPDEDGEYAYAWWDDIGQILYHTATMMPSNSDDPQCTNKKRHIGNDYVRIVWNDSGMAYRFDTLTTQFQFVNIVIEPHSLGAIAAFSNNLHENEYFKVTVQRADGMTEFAPVGHFKLISAENLPLLVRQLSLLADWFASVFERTQNDTVRVEMKTNWHVRLEAIRRFRNQLSVPGLPQPVEGIMGQEVFRDFTTSF